MSTELPGYDAWKLASPPERYMPPSVEDILGNWYVTYDEDGELCMFAYADDYEHDEWGPDEYDCEGFPSGGGSVTYIELVTYSPDGVRNKYGERERVDDLADGGSEYEWKLLDGKPDLDALVRKAYARVEREYLDDPQGFRYMSPGGTFCKNRDERIVAEFDKLPKV